MSKEMIEIEDIEENWENGSLGRDPDNVEAVSDAEEAAIDDSLELQMISIRLNKSLIRDFKILGRIYKLGYQPLIREALQRFAAGEMKMLYKQHLAQRQKEAEESKMDNAELVENTTPRKQA